MKKYIIVFFIFLLNFGLPPNSNCKNYAILISGGHGVPDDYRYIEFTAYWYDLVLAYKYLIDSAGYEHDDVYVFFGDGNNWENTTINDSLYKLSFQRPDWPDIVDYPNDTTSVETEIEDFADNIITNKDNLLIWLPRGHGAGDINDPDDDDYTATIAQKLSDSTSTGWYFSEKSYNPCHYRIIYDVLKFEDGSGKKYKRKKILWSTCRSEHVIVGNKTLLNGGDPNNSDDNKTIVITSSDYNKEGIRCTVNGERHSGFNYAIYCTLMEKDPWGGDVNFQSEPDDNGDGVISMAELFESIEQDSVFWGISFNSAYGKPHKADPCPMEDYLYIDEHLKLENATLSLMDGENKRYYRVDKITTGNNLVIPVGSKIEFVVDTEVKFKSGFHAEKGSRLHARIGEIECP